MVCVCVWVLNSKSFADFFLFRFPLFFDIFDIFFSKMLLFLFCSAVENTSDDHHHGFFFLASFRCYQKQFWLFFSRLFQFLWANPFVFFLYVFKSWFFCCFLGEKLYFCFIHHKHTLCIRQNCDEIDFHLAMFQSLM